MDETKKTFTRRSTGRRFRPSQGLQKRSATPKRSVSRAGPPSRAGSPHDVPRPALDDAAVLRLRHREETNARFRHLLKQGQTGLSIAFDLPTQMGYDADDSMAGGSRPCRTVAISSIEDMEALLDGIPLDKVSTSMTINATAAVLLSLYIAVAKKQGWRREKIRGTIQNDI